MAPGIREITNVVWCGLAFRENVFDPFPAQRLHLQRRRVRNGRVFGTKPNNRSLHADADCALFARAMIFRSFKSRALISAAVIRPRVI